MPPILKASGISSREPNVPVACTESAPPPLVTVSTPTDTAGASVATSRSGAGALPQPENSGSMAADTSTVGRQTIRIVVIVVGTKG